MLNLLAQVGRALLPQRFKGRSRDDVNAADRDPRQRQKANHQRRGGSAAVATIGPT